MNWLADRLRALVDVVHSPERAFARDLSGPSWLIPYAVLGSAAVLIAALQFPIHLHWTRIQMEAAGTTQEHIASSLALLTRLSRFSQLGTFLLLLFRWTVTSLLLWLTLQLAIQEVSFSTVLNVVSYAYPPILFRDGVIFLILKCRGKEVLESAHGLNVAIGVNLLFPSLPQPWESLAANFNMFELWFVTLLVIGISKTSASRWPKALAIVLPNWFFLIFIQFGFAALVHMLQQQLK